MPKERKKSKSSGFFDKIANEFRSSAAQIMRNPGGTKRRVTDEKKKRK